MCSIFGYSAKDISLKACQESFLKTKHRGPDDTRWEEVADGYLGFHRLSIMGLSEEAMQPFKRNQRMVVCNGEIYGFRTLKKQLQQTVTFTSDSDCELLLPLYEQYGFNMFAMLDAEFALVMYDGVKHGWIAARDPLGIRPLYYGYSASGHIMFASEAIALVGLCSDICLFPPGHYYYQEQFISYCDITKSTKVIDDEIDTIAINIREKLIKGVEKRLDADVTVGYLLSGGLDSSLVCSIASRLKQSKIKTFAIGMISDAIDLKYAKQVAEYLGTDHTEVIITKKDVLDALEPVIKTLGTFDITTIRASIGMYLVCKAIRQKTDIKVLLTGEISDELFGYKYTDFAPSAFAFQAEAEKRIREIHMYDVLRADRTISAHGLEARVPFGDLDFVRYVMAIDSSKKMNTYNQGKYLLRQAFIGYLPDNILQREKAAFSDAVGHSLVDYLKEYAQNKYSDDDFTLLANKYQHAKPFTKESLLYRELFEKFYPNQGKMIIDFWMPNKDWVGCCVNDPSARVLANYGASGK